MLNLNWNYDVFILMLMVQILVTTIIIPIYTYKYVGRYMESFTRSHMPDVNLSSLEQFRPFLYVYIGLTASVALTCITVAYTAIANGTELFGWDNQAGLIVLAILSFLPFLFMLFVVSRFERFASEHAPKVRKASLKVSNWTGYFPRALVTALLIGQVLYIASVVYFVASPFEGFAGYANLLGLVLLDGIFIMGIYFSVFVERQPAGLSTDQKEAAKHNIAVVNLWCWILAIYYIALSLWVNSAGDATDVLSLTMQSVYFQLALLLGTGFIKLKIKRN